MMNIITWNVPYIKAEGSRSAECHVEQVSGWSGKGKGRAEYVINRTSLGDPVTLRWGVDSGARDMDQGWSVVTPSKIGRKGWRQLDILNGTRRDDRYRAYQFQRGGDGPQSTILIYEAPDTTSFMGHLPDDMLLGEVAMPGTHESCALYGYPISQCQQPATPIASQLRDGIRFLDVRLKVVGTELLMYHGIRPERSSLPILLSVLHDFLASYPSETVVVLIKEETPPFHPDFSGLLFEHLEPYMSKFWFLENRIPRLGEVRGKAILLSRFESGPDDGWNKTGIGIHPYTWPDSKREGFSWNCSGTDFRIQDWYRVQTFLEIPEKFHALINHLNPTLSQSPRPQFTLSYSSASSFPFSFPTVIAKGFGYPQWGLGVQGVNTRFTQWLLERIAEGKKVRACVMMDFYKQEGWAGELLVLMNLMEGEGEHLKVL